MPFNLTPEDLHKMKNSHFMPEFKNAEMLLATYLTDANLVKEILPRPLMPTEVPMVHAFVAHYPETNFGCIYSEGALLLKCKFRREQGLYCLSMPVDDDMAMIGGRESYGYPKKIADQITLVKNDNHVTGSVIRKKKEILKIECELTEGLTPDFTKDFGDPVIDWNGASCFKVVMFLYKFFPSPGGTSFDYLPRLIREPVLFRKGGEILQGKGEVTVSSTPFDPLGEIIVNEVKSINYGKWNNTMLPGKVVGRTWNPLRFLKHSFFKTDYAPVILENYDSANDKRAKEIIKAARSL